MAEGNSSSSGTSIIGLLGVVFITLKLCGVIDWSWWWVTAPFWLGIPICVLVFIIMVAIITAIARSK